MLLRTYLKKNASFLFVIACQTSTAFAIQGGQSEITLGKFDSNVFLIVESEKVTRAKVAQSIDGQDTFGGVTGLSSQLMDFSIPFSTQSQSIEFQTNQPVFTIEAFPNQNEVCSQLQFMVAQNKIELLPNSIKLNTATNCTFSIYNSKKTEIATFRILLNHTFSYWCQNVGLGLEAFITARLISPTCSVDPNKVYYINLPNKAIRDLSPIAGFKKIRSLILTGNEIADLPLGIFDHFTELKYLILQNNKITTIPLGALDKLTKLNWLWLMDNNIQDIRLGLFDKLQDLDWLCLSRNKIEELPKGLLVKLKNLNSLELSDNLIRIFPPDISELKKLISIEMESNQIQEIPSGAFSGMSRLTNLSLAKNQLTTLPTDFLDGLKQIYFLKLSHNHISDLPAEVLKRFFYLKVAEFDFSENPITSSFLDIKQN